MTDLLSRPLGRFSRPSAGPEPGSRPTTPAGPVGRPLTLSAALAGLGSAIGTLLTCMAFAVAGWYLADAGAYGSTNGALRIGADAWMFGHGARLDLNGVPLGIVPLGLSALFALVSFRAGRWAGSTSQPIEDDRSLAIGVVISTGLYVVVAAVTGVAVGQTPVAPSLSRLVIGALLISGIAGGAGLAVGTGRSAVWFERVPGWVRAVSSGIVSAALLLFAASAVLVGVSLALSWNDAATMLSDLQLHTGDAIMYTLVVLAYTPNAALFGTAYALGPGFTLGTGTLIAPSAVTLGPMPAFPLLAALPSVGPTPWWTYSVMAFPVLAAAVAAGLAQRRYRVVAWDSAALRGFGIGFGGGVLTTLLVALSGGPMGTGRLTHVGAPMAEVLVMAVAAMSVGGLVGGLVVTWWQRRGAVVPAVGDEA